uniref:Uncharacterized protein n=1 Tax=Oryza sativa subsp. japonica TaxID=39947 RepID=Q6Z8A0_ORYSJ|nr:hypothetical protein [Oryza sativa Japonica Group]BAD07899.1 hypothetical protein [Oryza sativa Japonica Group]
MHRVTTDRSRGRLVLDPSLQAKWTDAAFVHATHTLLPGVLERRKHVEQRLWWYGKKPTGTVRSYQPSVSTRYRRPYKPWAKRGAGTIAH